MKKLFYLLLVTLTVSSTLFAAPARTRVETINCATGASGDLIESLGMFMVFGYNADSTRQVCLCLMMNQFEVGNYSTDNGAFNAKYSFVAYSSVVDLKTTNLFDVLSGNFNVSINQAGDTIISGTMLAIDKKDLTDVPEITTTISLKKHNSPQIHEYVDLGLPSGTKWATMNIGADSVRGIGAFFAYGDVTPDYAVPGQKSGYARSFDWPNYKWCTETGKDSYSLTKYCTSSMSGTEDGLKQLLPEDDAATALWGNDWRTPTQHEYIELWANCNHDTVWENGVFGLRLTSRVPGYEDRSIFFPYTGIRENNGWKGYEDQIVAAYMTANHENKFGDYFSFPDQQEMIIHVISRYIGVNVRAVYNQKTGCSPVDLGLNVLWATGNINATSFDERGDYFAWGSIVNVSPTTWDTYPFGTMDNLTKYNTKAESGVVDNKTELEDVDEVAKALCGNGWRMPDTTDWQELVAKCEWTWVDTLTVPGYMITSKVPGYENARIFLPAIGFKEDIYINQPYTDFYYYTSHLSKTDPNKAISVYFSDITDLTIESDFRYYGFACRPVKDKQPTGLIDTNDNSKSLIQNSKLIKNGQLFILKNGKTYNAVGVEL